MDKMGTGANFIRAQLQIKRSVNGPKICFVCIIVAEINSVEYKIYSSVLSNVYIHYTEIFIVMKFLMTVEEHMENHFIPCHMSCIPMAKMKCLMSEETEIQHYL